ncbi:MAG: DNA adenine methylase [Chloroflexota bacterium]|nr:DNA adenine methylase [Chloroflexota bacterium]
MAKPFLKWAGGKARLAPLIADRIGREPHRINRYHEPFLGGGAVFFALHEAGLIRDASLADSNTDLIATYQAVRDDVEGVINALGAYARSYLALEPSQRGLYYYDVRNRRRLRRTDRKAARLLFLNKTCYNGLYRVNSKGHFNVPHGRHQNLRILDRENLRSAARALADADTGATDFEEACARAQPGDFVYLDPPYQPLNETSHFTSYTRDDFGFPDQERLRVAFDSLTSRGVPALLSNSDHPAIRDLYEGYAMEEVLMGRNINSKATERSPINELLVSNLERLSRVDDRSALALAGR